jgi:Na+/phosphate symporter
MNPAARATSITNFLFNAAGMLVYLPFLRRFARTVVDWTGDPGTAVASAQLIFNLTIAFVFLLTLDWIEPRLRWLSGDTEVIAKAQIGSNERVSVPEGSSG